MHLKTPILSWFWGMVLKKIETNYSTIALGIEQK
jgi:hypothetical protein